MVRDTGNEKLIVLRLDFQKNLKPEDKTCLNYYTSHAFIQLIMIFEMHLMDYCKLVLKIHPEKISKRTISISELVECTSIDHVMENAIDGYINEISRQKPLEYFNTIIDILSIDKFKLSPFWMQLIEAKARRDLGVRGDWNVNDVYMRKMKDAEIPLEMISNESCLIPNIKYFTDVYESLDCIMKAVYRSCSGKFGYDAL